MKLKLMLVIYLLPSLILAQSKIYVPSEESYVEIIEYQSWYESDLNEYYGEYLYILPTVNELGEYNGDGYYEKFIVSNDSLNNIQIYILGEIDGSIEPEIDTLVSIEIKCDNKKGPESYCNIESNIFNGRFVLFKYKNQNNSIKEVKGIMVVNQSEDSDYFYERKKSK